MAEALRHLGGGARGPYLGPKSPADPDILASVFKALQLPGGSGLTRSLVEMVTRVRIAVLADPGKYPTGGVWDTGDVRSSAARAQTLSSSAVIPTYREVVELFRRTRELLRGHLDDFFTACLLATVDLEAVFADALLRPDCSIDAEEFWSQLKLWPRLDLSGVDRKDVE